MRIVVQALAVLAVIFSFSFPTYSAIPTTVNYQGYLAGTDGVPLNSQLSVEFRLYQQAQGGVELWVETHQVMVRNGFFNTELGANTAFPDQLFENPVFLGITVIGDSEMTPRLRFSSVPTALHAQSIVACGNGITNCNGVCVNLQSDEMNCGVCSNQCNTGAGELCLDGTCSTDPDADMDGFTVVAGGDCDDNNNQVFPNATEICNGIDDDCDGINDDFVAPEPCSLQQGVCAGATANCDSSGSFPVCGAADYGSNYQAQETVCDGLDNDCDGLVDEETDLQNDPQNCGSCATVCPSSPSACLLPACTSGSCDFAPAPSGTICESGTCDGAGNCISN